MRQNNTVHSKQIHHIMQCIENRYNILSYSDERFGRFSYEGYKKIKIEKTRSNTLNAVYNTLSSFLSDVLMHPDFKRIMQLFPFEMHEERTSSFNLLLLYLPQKKSQVNIQ